MGALRERKNEGTAGTDEEKVQDGSIPSDNLQLVRAHSCALFSRDRDGQRGDKALVNLWREVSKPRRGGAIPCQPAGCKFDADDLFNDWLEKRGLLDALSFDREERGWRVYRYARTPAVEAGPEWEPAFHGTWWYAVWSILDSGVLLESNDRDLGHDYWEPGVYCSPSLDTGLWYARPQILFGDGVFHRVIFELRVDPAQNKKYRKRGGIQWVFPTSGVSLHGLWFRPNAPPMNGEERVNEWQPELEALPGCLDAPEATVNTRTGPWPFCVDPYPFDAGDMSAPPWMQGGGGGAGNSGGAAEDPGAREATEVATTPSLQGLYGRWYKKARKGELHPDWYEIATALDASTATSDLGASGCGAGGFDANSKNVWNNTDPSSCGKGWNACSPPQQWSGRIGPGGCLPPVWPASSSGQWWSDDQPPFSFPGQQQHVITGACGSWQNKSRPRKRQAPQQPELWPSVTPPRPRVWAPARPAPKNAKTPAKPILSEKMTPSSAWPMALPSAEMVPEGEKAAALPLFLQ